MKTLSNTRKLTLTNVERQWFIIDVTGGFYNGQVGTGFTGYDNAKAELTILRNKTHASI